MSGGFRDIGQCIFHGGPSTDAQEQRGFAYGFTGGYVSGVGFIDDEIYVEVLRDVADVGDFVGGWGVAE